MNYQTVIPPLPGNPISRERFVPILQAALCAGAEKFARQAALSWLAYYPGDLQINLLYAQSLLKLGMVKQALPILEHLCMIDPEYLEAQKLLTTTKELTKSKSAADAHSCLCALGVEVEGNKSVSDWANNIQAARKYLSQDNGVAAGEKIHQALLEDPPTPLAHVTHLQVGTHNGLPMMTIRDLAQCYSKRWPKCVHFMLLQADTLMGGGEAEKAVALLHQAAAQDVTGQVATRLWGENHPYRSLWPQKLEAPLELSIPAEVSAAMGWNQLPRGNMRTPMHHQSSAQSNVTHQSKRWTDWVPETLRTVKAELERVANQLGRRDLVEGDGRYPVYVIITTQSGLQHQYGDQAKEVDKEMKRLVSTISARRDWRATLVYADDPKCMATHGLSAVKPDDAWGLKLAIADLDERLGKKGEMIGAVLIVGGPEVVPFHLLPNPVDDGDTDVPSDNPYSTRDENYFAPEWLLGRIPGGTSSDPSHLLHILKEISTHQSKVATNQQWQHRIWNWISTVVRVPFHRIKLSVGYTAAVWLRASLSVFRPIGQLHSLLISPPVRSDNQQSWTNKAGLLPNAQLAYFNLHGLKESSVWYGQRDPLQPTTEPDYPVALRPQDVTNSGKAPQVVFSEACYGAYIYDKEVEEALALKFLASGTQVVVGSTCTAYGSVSAPLIGADLLGQTFWKFLREGLTAGDAFRRAKILVAREMHRRQGYLDGEDQKTLISFVLYGDPLAVPSGMNLSSKGVYRPMKRMVQIRTVCDRSSEQIENEIPETDNAPVSADTLEYVKHVVKQYLPGMQDAQYSFNQMHMRCEGGNHTCPTSQFNNKARPQKSIERNVITLRKQVTGSKLVHNHYARLTLNKQGKIIKMAVSR